MACITWYLYCWSNLFIFDVTEVLAMTNYENQNNSQPTERRRSRRSERSQQLFESRTFLEEQPVQEYYKRPQEAAEQQPSQAAQQSAEPFSYAAYTPNESRTYTDETFQQTRRSRRRASYEQALDTPPQPVEDVKFSFVTSQQPVSENWAAYRRPGLDAEAAGEEASEDTFAYAPPVKLPFAGYDLPESAEEEMPVRQETVSEYGTANVYRPRTLDHSYGQDENPEDYIPDAGYQVQEEKPIPKKKKKGGVLIVLTVLALAVAAAFLFLPKQLSEIAAKLTGTSTETADPMAVAPTPPPVRSYDAATPVQISSVTGGAISQISGTTEMEPHAVKETSLLTRNARGDGQYDFYLFSAKDGRLLAYFEKLGMRDAFPLADGGYFVRQSPYLINEDGSAMIPVHSIQQQVEGEWTLHPMMNGWAQITQVSTGKKNLINRESVMLNRFWMEKLWPMTGEATVGYVDTGNAADTEGRYSLYVLSKDGQCVKWLSEGTMDSVVASACGAVYMADGSLYLLSDTETPLILTDDVKIYVDCQAVVIKDPATGKYGLYVQGMKHYDFLFDEIRPVESELNWHSETFSGAGGTMTLSYVTDAEYPQPLTHYFLLRNGETEEYVALSTLSGCPVILD